MLCCHAVRMAAVASIGSSLGRVGVAFRSLLASASGLTHDVLQEAGNAPSNENGAHPCKYQPADCDEHARWPHKSIVEETWRLMQRTCGAENLASTVHCEALRGIRKR